MIDVIKMITSIQKNALANESPYNIERFMGYASKAEMLRIDMALLVSLALNVLSGNRSE